MECITTGVKFLLIWSSLNVVDSFSINEPDATLIQTFNGDVGSYLGGSIAIDGDYAAIKNIDSVLVYKYDNELNTYIYKQTLNISGELAIYDSTIVVEGWSECYVFELDRNNDTWHESATFNITGSHNSIGISNNMIIIGDPYTTDSGSVDIYHKNVSNSNYNKWIKTQTLYANDRDDYDRFGISLSLCPNNKQLIVGASFNDDLGLYSGSAYIFEYNNMTLKWNQTQKLSAYDGSSSDRFGSSVTFDKYDNDCKYAIIGATGVNNDSGAMYVFKKSTTNNNYERVIKLLPKYDESSDDQYCGLNCGSYAFYNNIFAMSCVAANNYTGGVYLYLISNNNVTLIDYLTANYGQRGDFYGDSVAIYNNILMISAPRRFVGGYDAGSVYIYDINIHLYNIYNNSDNYNYITIYSVHGVTWQEAENYCIDFYRSNLVSIHSETENLVAYNMINDTNEYVWIGYNKINNNNEYSWSDGSRNNYNNLNINSTLNNNDTNNDDCVAYLGTNINNSRDWNILSCDNKNSYFICNCMFFFCFCFWGCLSLHRC